VDLRNLDKEQQRALYVTVLNAARKIARRECDVEELTQQALLRLLNTSPSTLDGEVELKQRVYGILRSLRSNAAASSVTRREYERRAGEEHAALSDAGRSPEQIILDDAERVQAEELASERVAKLRVRLAGLELDLQIVDRMLKGVTKRSDLVARTGRSPGEVKTALARIRRHMDAIVAAERGEDKDEEVKS
jgi:DNA-directed RNA polymerase specialized sigma24 family protein